MLTEKQKYLGVYRENKNYGKTNHGKDILDYVRQLDANSICDVGCGDGAFCRGLLGDVQYLYGVDFASSPRGNGVWWSNCPAEKIILPNKSIDYVTSFDVLEHLLPENVDKTLAEFIRLARKGLVLSISYRDSSTKYKGHTLHMTVKPEEWWIKKLLRCGTVTKQGQYLLVEIC